MIKGRCGQGQMWSRAGVHRRCKACRNRVETVHTHVSIDELVNE